MSLIFGVISGLFASVSRTPLRAVMTGICILLLQVGVDILIHAIGLTKFSYGM
jgi:hypothetical protein